MRAREDVAALLRQGLSDREIAVRLHVDAKAVAPMRTALGLPKHRRGRPAAPSVEALFHGRTVRVAGGHLHWTGHRQSGTAVVRWQGRLHTALRVAFGMRYDRAPVGQVRACCGDPACVAPDHVEDRPMRERNQTVFEAIFGSPP